MQYISIITLLRLLIPITQFHQPNPGKLVAELPRGKDHIVQQHLGEFFCQVRESTSELILEAIMRVGGKKKVS